MNLDPILIGRLNTLFDNSAIIAGRRVDRALEFIGDEGVAALTLAGPTLQATKYHEFSRHLGWQDRTLIENAINAAAAQDPAAMEAAARAAYTARVRGLMPEEWRKNSRDGRDCPLVKAVPEDAVFVTGSATLGEVESGVSSQEHLRVHGEDVYFCRQRTDGAGDENRLYPGRARMLREELDDLVGALPHLGFNTLHLGDQRGGLDTLRLFEGAKTPRRGRSQDENDLAIQEAFAQQKERLERVGLRLDYTAVMSSQRRETQRPARHLRPETPTMDSLPPVRFLFPEDGHTYWQDERHGLMSAATFRDGELDLHNFMIVATDYEVPLTDEEHERIKAGLEDAAVTLKVATTVAARAAIGRSAFVAIYAGPENGEATRVGIFDNADPILTEPGHTPARRLETPLQEEGLSVHWREGHELTGFPDVLAGVRVAQEESPEEMGQGMSA